MRVTLNDIEELRHTQMIAKAKENDTLQTSINEIRQKSRQVSYHYKCDVLCKYSNIFILLYILQN